METVTSADGTTIGFDKLGSGAPLILVGGAFQHRAFDPRTQHLAALLAERFTVYHYDRRGRGDSTDTQPYAVEREIEDLDALIAGAGGHANVFGMSSGAVLALRAAARGSAITRLVIYEAPFVVDDSQPPTPPTYLDDLRAHIAAGRRGDAITLFMTAAVGVPAQFLEPMRQSPLWAGFEAVAHTLPYDAAIMDGTLTGRPPAGEPWTSVKVPTLVLAGTAGGDRMRNAARAIAAVLPDARHAELADQTHDVAPEVLAPELIGFLS